MVPSGESLAQQQAGGMLPVFVFTVTVEGIVTVLLPKNVLESGKTVVGSTDHVPPLWNVRAGAEGRKQ